MTDWPAWYRRWARLKRTRRAARNLEYVYRGGYRYHNVMALSGSR